MTAGRALSRLGAALARVLLAAALCAGALPAAAALLGHGGPVQAVDVSADGRHALTGGFDYTVILWDLESQVPVRILTGHDGGVSAVRFVPGSTLRGVSAGDDGDVILWDLHAGRILHRMKGHALRAVELAVSPDGRLAASAGWDGTVRVWDLETGTARHVFETRANRINTVAFAGGGTQVLAGDEAGQLLVWSVGTGEAMRPLRVHDFVVNALDVADPAAASTTVATASVDRTMRLWSWPAREELVSIELHDAAVLALAISDDGTLLASSGADGAIRLWSIPDGRPAGTLTGHAGAVFALAFAPGGRLLSAGRDESVRVWSLAGGTEIAPAGATNIPAPETVADMTEAEKRGQWEFRKCRICHSITAEGENRAGPTLYGIVGRVAGTVPGYDYSPALTGTGIVWTPDMIARLFADGPDRVTPGSKMPLQKLSSPQARDDLIAYIEKVTAPKPGVPVPGQMADAPPAGQGAKQ
ncbi:WD40 domain-containing protein [Futiania mangrovi]|uniref:Cytochrome c domain-containing protein n=1 Tax=Futiania mangrovi TaxID=2959716 RepID=A0A9J6PCP5_9PROT|nr:hypothetical protein [Futiania mangrovii]MCP1335419.1 hypothetical protein [Futiania mangrovii]